MHEMSVRGWVGPSVIFFKNAWARGHRIVVWFHTGKYVQLLIINDTVGNCSTVMLKLDVRGTRKRFPILPTRNAPFRERRVEQFQKRSLFAARVHPKNPVRRYPRGSVKCFVIYQGTVIALLIVDCENIDFWQRQKALAAETTCLNASKATPNALYTT